jgi:hypothetical protein
MTMGWINESWRTPGRDGNVSESDWTGIASECTPSHRREGASERLPPAGGQCAILAIGTQIALRSFSFCDRAFVPADPAPAPLIRKYRLTAILFEIQHLYLR